MAISSISDSLKAAVTHMYDVFAVHELHGSSLVVCHCPCCMSREHEYELVKTPLDLVSANLLAEYTNSAHAWSEQASREMRYFLPRYCELIAHNDPPDHLGGIDVCLRRLGYDAAWCQAWPAHESVALNLFFLELLRDRLKRAEVHSAGYYMQEEISGVLLLAITAGAQLTPLLAAWDVTPEPGATLHMAGIRLGLRHFADGRAPRFNDAHLQNHRAEAEMIAAFVLRADVTARIEAAFFATTSEAQQRLLSAAAMQTR